MGSQLKSVVRHTTGFTLIEVVVVIGIFGLISVGVISLVSTVFVQSTKQGTSIADTDQARKLSIQFSQELRNAVYGVTGAYPLNSAGDQEIIFFSNVDNDPQIERVRYYLQNGSLYKGIVDPTGSPATYNLATEVATKVQSNVANGSTPLFYYYNDSYDGTTGSALAQPVNVSQVNFIKLNLVLYNKAASSGTTYTVTGGSTIRNLKTNLGD